MKKADLLTEHNSQIVTKKEKIAVSLRKIGAQGITTFMNSYGTVFLTEAYFAKYSYASVAGTIGIISGVSVVLGCIMSMIAGTLVYKINFKGGKYRPWVLLAGVPVFLYALSYFFAPTGLDADALITLRWIVILLGSAINAFVTQSDNILQVISGDDAEKKKVINLHSIMNYVGYGGVYLFYAVFGTLENAAIKFLLVAVIFAVIRLIGDILTWLWCKERIEFSKKTVKITDAGLSPLRHRPFLAYNAAVWIRSLLGMTGIVIASFCQCTVGSENMLLVTIPSAVGTVAGLLLFMKLTKKIQASRLLQMAGVYVLIMAVCLVAVGFSVNWYDETIADNEAYIEAYNEAYAFACEYEGVAVDNKEDITLKADISVIKEDADGNHYTATFAVSEPIADGEYEVVAQFGPVAHVKTSTLLPILFYVFYFLFGFYFGFETIGYEHLRMETLDYLEWKMNQRVESVAGIVPGWIQSGLEALKKAIIPIMLLYVGFQNAVVDRNGNTVLTVAENIARAGVDNYNDTCRWVLMCGTLTTACAALLAAVFLSFYGLNKQKKETMYAELAVMRAQRSEDAAD